MSARIIYSRGFPYGAPLFMLRGGGLNRSGVKGWLREEGFRWNSQTHAWEHYMYRDDAARVLRTLQDAYGCEIVPKADLNPSYIIDLERSLP